MQNRCTKNVLIGFGFMSFCLCFFWGTQKSTTGTQIANMDRKPTSALKSAMKLFCSRWAWIKQPTRSGLADKKAAVYPWELAVNQSESTKNSQNKTFPGPAPRGSSFAPQQSCSSYLEPSIPSIPGEEYMLINGTSSNCWVNFSFTLKGWHFVDSKS